MRAMLLAVGAAAVLVGSAGAQAPALGAKPKDGFWKPESAQFDGEQGFPTPQSKQMVTLVMADGQYRLYAMTDPKQGTGRRVAVAAFKPGAAPGQFEMEITDGYRKGAKLHGIYEVTGDRFKLCYGPTDKPRPAGYAAPAGSGLICEEWVYMTPQPKAAGG